MISPSIMAGYCGEPTIFELDQNFHITAVKQVGVATANQLPLNLVSYHFLSLIPPEARCVADDFFDRLLVEEACSTNQLFLQYPGQKSVPIDLLCRKLTHCDQSSWEVVVWNRERFSRTERELMLLYAVSSKANPATDELAFAEEVLFQIHNMMDVDASALLYLQQGRLQVTATRGLSCASKTLLGNLPDWQVDLYQPLDSVDPLALMPEGVTQLAASICESSDCRHWLAVPIRTPRKYYGILAVSRKSAEPFTERERHLLMSLGRNLANGREKGRLFRGIKERNQKLARSRRELRSSLGQLERAHRELQHLDEMKKSFVTLASHELQTPLTSIIGNAELLKKDFAELPERTRLSLTEMLAGVDDLRARIEVLLAANRVGSGLFVPRFNRCTIQQIFSDLEPEISEIAVDRILNLWRCKGTDSVDLLLDIELVKQALRLQLDNAIRHTQAGGEISLRCVEKSAGELQEQSALLYSFYPDVEKRLSSYADYLLMTVEDNGEGINDSEKMKIFTPFYGGSLVQHHSSRGFNYSGKGFGLGLSLAKRIIEAHNGLFWVEDRAGGGSRFCQLLPQMV